MKQAHFFKLSTVVLFAAPLFLSGCDTLQDMFGDTSSAAHYDYTRPAPIVTTTNPGRSTGAQDSGSTGGGSSSHVARKRGVTATTLADPVDAAVVHPKTSVSTPASVPLAAPSVAQ